MKIVILDGQAVNPGDLSWDCFNQFGTVTVYQNTANEADVITRIADNEIVLVNKAPITAAVLEACPAVRLICVVATGYNIVDCKAARAKGIPVCNVPSYGTDAVAQFTIALLLEICHRISYHDALVHEGEWGKCGSFCFWRTPQMELAGKTLGIIGFGKIGRAVARIGRALGMKVLAHSRSENSEGKKLAEYVALENLLSEADIISLHCPLFPETEKIINTANIAKMKDGAMLVNTARGGLVDEEALVEALESGKLRYAAVDVVSQEPMREDNPLLKTRKCIITPHIAWAPVESRQRLMDCVEENIRCYLNGHPQNVVNM
jgi:glycerate dehydrogenase